MSGLSRGEYSVTGVPEFARIGASRQYECEIRYLKQGQAWGCTLMLSYDWGAAMGGKE